LISYQFLAGKERRGKEKKEGKEGKSQRSSSRT
jgi:hypothetical protein